MRKLKFILGLIENIIREKSFTITNISIIGRSLYFTYNDLINNSKEEFKITICRLKGRKNDE